MKTKAKAGDWWDLSWNPITGCTACSPGCERCWARGMVERFPQLHGYQRPMGPDYDDGDQVPFQRVQFHPERMLKPLGIAPGVERPVRIFCVDLGDWCHEDVPREWQVRMLAVMMMCPWHTFIVCTKRAGRQRELLADMATWSAAFAVAVTLESGLTAGRLRRLKEWTRQPGCLLGCWPLPNLWVLTTVCNQEEANQRLPELLATPAAVRGAHVEPMLGPVDLRQEWFCTHESCRDFGPSRCDHPVCESRRLHWVVCGGENGAGARPMHQDWAVDLLGQCRVGGVPFWFKGRGTATLPKSDPGYRRLDGREWNGLPGDPDEAEG